MTEPVEKLQDEHKRLIAERKRIWDSVKDFGSADAIKTSKAESELSSIKIQINACEKKLRQALGVSQEELIRRKSAWLQQ